MGFSLQASAMISADTLANWLSASLEEDLSTVPGVGECVSPVPGASQAVAAVDMAHSPLRRGEAGGGPNVQPFMSLCIGCGGCHERPRGLWHAMHVRPFAAMRTVLSVIS